ncbi:MAG TPA: galactose oxidase-like domain-containing protein [Pyrinomonadaceae bacterium]
MSVINKKYAELGGASGLLGAPIAFESVTEDGKGLFRPYQNGSIYWTAETGAHEVHGAIRARWAVLDLEKGVLGYPLTDEAPVGDDIGRYNEFQNGYIYWTPETGAHEVCGPIFDLWRSLGGKSHLGYPASDELKIPYANGTLKEFQHGSIYSDDERGTYVVYPLPEKQKFDEAISGRWEESISRSEVVGIHAALMHTEKVLFFCYGIPNILIASSDPKYPGSALLDPSTGDVQPLPLILEDLNLFCSGHTFLQDGRLLVCGSERMKTGAHEIHAFNPELVSGGAWERLLTMKDARWYPTCVTLPDGKAFIIGGHIWNESQNVPNQTYEIYDAANGLQQPQQVSIFTGKDGADSALYPFVIVLPSGQLFIHIGTTTHFLDLSTWKFNEKVLETADRPDRNSRTYPVQGTCVLLPLLPDTEPPYRARVMLIGGGGAQETTAQTLATNTCEVLDVDDPSASWQLVEPMSHPRVMPDAILLPDGKVFVTNGSSTGKANAGANPVLQSELYDPKTNKWTPLCSMEVPRLYHSTALLLPDGRVMTAGADSIWYPATYGEQLTVEIYSPPYIFRGPRPIIQSVPNRIKYGEEFKIQALKPKSIAAAVLLRPGSVTHSFNSCQRYVGLSIVGRARVGNSIRLLAPPDSNVAPPGHYMLFLLNRDEIPSVARFIYLSE